MKILGVIVTILCDYCKGKKRLPGGKYKAQGEVINCPICNGNGTTKKEISLSEFRKQLE